MADWHTRDACQSLCSWSALDVAEVERNSEVSYAVNVAKEWLTEIEKKRKTIEGRLRKGKFASLKRGNMLYFNDQTLTAEILRVTPYVSFEEYLRVEGLEKTLPGVETIEEGVAVYRQFYSEEDEYLYGVLAIEFQLV